MENKEFKKMALLGKAVEQARSEEEKHSSIPTLQECLKRKHAIDKWRKEHPKEWEELDLEALYNVVEHDFD